MGIFDELDDLDVALGADVPGNRGAYRALIKGMQARVKGFEEPFIVKDLSATGCGMVAPESVKETLLGGRVLEMDLFAGDKPVILNIQAKIIRVLPGRVVACSFRELAEAQENKLDKLILEIQKYIIKRRKEFPLNR